MHFILLPTFLFYFIFIIKGCLKVGVMQTQYQSQYLLAENEILMNRK